MTAEPQPTSREDDRDYGSRIAAVEPGGNERVPDAERHGRPRQLFWTWASPNLEFATIFLGVLAVAVFGLTFWQAVAAIVLGNGLAALAHGVLSARGPEGGVPQMVLGRLAFGYRGNVVPSALMTITAGSGWFAVNSVSASFALSSLTGASPVLWLVVVVVVQVLVAFVGHNLVHAFERVAFPVLALVFAVGSVIVLLHADPSAGVLGAAGGIGGFLLTLGAVFGYTAGWSPYAADYARYLPVDSSRRAVGLAAGSGLFVSTTASMVVGAASVSASAAAGIVSDNPTTAFVGVLPAWLAALTLICIALGAVAANVLNVYSGGVVLTDQYLRRRVPVELLYDRGYANPAGVVALLVGIVVSVGLFSNQELFTGLVPRVWPGVGDITFLVGIALVAGLYAVLFRRSVGT